ncbi:hypothetical protein PR048_024259 [Dryococelus australis]|uniref:Uncharacterized protein n=1 Tax=Dryococelus australis TaxID=614101 RepID=A0ABQ9GN59_9NEOP|nr:hypothetical protein PR048_024259 [Dryococelus australis]
MVAEWLACSLLTLAIRVLSPAGSLRFFTRGNCAGNWSARIPARLHRKCNISALGFQSCEYVIFGPPGARVVTSRNVCRLSVWPVDCTFDLVLKIWLVVFVDMLYSWLYRPVHYVAVDEDRSTELTATVMSDLAISPLSLAEVWGNHAKQARMHRKVKWQQSRCEQRLARVAVELAMEIRERAQLQPYSECLNQASVYELTESKQLSVAFLNRLRVSVCVGIDRLQEDTCTNCELRRQTLRLSREKCPEERAVTVSDIVRLYLVQDCTSLPVADRYWCWSQRAGVVDGSSSRTRLAKECGNIELDLVAVTSRVGRFTQLSVYMKPAGQHTSRELGRILGARNVLGNPFLLRNISTCAQCANLLKENKLQAMTDCRFHDTTHVRTTISKLSNIDKKKAFSD